VWKWVPHPHIEERKNQKPVKVHEIPKNAGPIARFNAQFGLKVTLVVGTMWCAYLFTLLALISLPSAIKSGSSIIIVAWIAQTFIQLVLLPIIIVGQNQQAAASDKRSAQTYTDAEAILHECMQLQQHLQAQDERLSEILEHAKAGAA
jgi:hypothetical protein